MGLRSVARALTPPVVWDAVRGMAKRRRRRAKTERWGFGREQPAEYYDATFASGGQWKLHYTQSPYYPLWTLVADRVRAAGAASVLDIGCGPGQLACLLRDQGVPRYLGLDFSAARIDAARQVCPEFEFEAADVFTSPALETRDYDTCIVLEFLEHVERDLDVLTRVRPGTRVLATVPSFPDHGHVRHFADAAEVAARYGSSLAALRVDVVRANEKGRRWFVLDATR